MIDNKTMKVKGGDYFTVVDMAKYLDVTPKVVNMRLFRLGIKPISKDALYSASDFDKIKTVIRGRPKKAPESKPNKKQGKGKNGK